MDLTDYLRFFNDERKKRMRDRLVDVLGASLAEDSVEA